MTEDNLQKACIEWMSWQYPRYAQLLHHSPNGGYRNAIEAAKFKAMGTRAGFPDLFLPVARNGCHGLAIELKVGRNKQSDYQVRWQAALYEQGYRYELCYTFDRFREIMREYLGEPASKEIWQ